MLEKVYVLKVNQWCIILSEYRRWLNYFLFMIFIYFVYDMIMCESVDVIVLVDKRYRTKNETIKWEFNEW